MNKYLAFLILITFSCSQTSKQDTENAVKSEEIAEPTSELQIEDEPEMIEGVTPEPIGNFVFQDSLFKKTKDYLGSLYLMKENDSIFTQLLLINVTNSQSDTLYFIDEEGRHFNGEGEFTALSRSKIVRYYLLKVMDNNLTIYGADDNNRPVTDPLWLGWNKGKEVFEWIRTP